MNIHKIDSQPFAITHSLHRCHAITFNWSNIAELEIDFGELNKITQFFLLVFGGKCANLDKDDKYQKIR